VEQFESFIGVNFWTALFTLLNFLALFFVARHFLIGPVLQLIQTRQKELDDMYADADSAKTQAQALQAEYQLKLDDAQAASERIVKEAVTRGQAREEEILRQARQEADAIRSKASADIAMEKKQAVNDAKDEISVIAVAIAGKVVGRELNAADHSRLVDEFIDELGEGL
jgi:F-type H+-transporting ATPase subunit b